MMYCAVLCGCTCVRSLYDDDERMGAEVSIAAYVVYVVLCVCTLYCLLSATCTVPPRAAGYEGRQILSAGSEGRQILTKFLRRAGKF